MHTATRLLMLFAVLLACLCPALAERIRDGLHPPVHLDLERPPLRADIVPERECPSDHGGAGRVAGTVLGHRSASGVGGRPDRVDPDLRALLCGAARLRAWAASDRLTGPCKNTTREA